MAPMRPHGERAASIQIGRKHFDDFEVFDRVAVDDWLCLARASERANRLGDDDAVCGASVLQRLQAQLPDLLPSAIDPSSLCLFFQWQHLERGTAVAPHVDANRPPADTVATLSLGSGAHDTVRVGHAKLRVTAGDLYAISGHARWDVDHEVHCSTSDRLSLTFRYARPENL